MHHGFVLVPSAQLHTNSGINGRELIDSRQSMTDFPLSMGEFSLIPIVTLQTMTDCLLTTETNGVLLIVEAKTMIHK